MQEKYGLISYYATEDTFTPAKTKDYFTFTLDFFKGSNMDLQKEFNMSDACIQVVSGGDVPDTLYICNGIGVNTLYYRLLFNVSICNKKVFLYTSMPNVRLRDCDVTIEFISNRHLEALQKICALNKSVTIETAYLCDIVVLEILSKYKNLKIKRICYKLPEGFELMGQFKLYYHDFKILSNYAKTSEVYAFSSLNFYVTSIPIYSPLFRFTKSALEERGLKSLNFKFYVFKCGMHNGAYIRNLSILDLSETEEVQNYGSKKPEFLKYKELYDAPFYSA
jgi:hypothetical protein